MIVIINVYEIRKFANDIFSHYTSKAHEHGYVWSENNAKTDFICFIDWVLKRYFHDCGFRVMTYVNYDDFNLLYKDLQLELFYVINHFITLRAPNIFNLNKQNYLLNLIVSDSDLVISLEKE